MVVMMKSSIPLHETEQVIVLENGTCQGRQTRMGWRIDNPSALGGASPTPAGQR